jgi:hypothetical protein
MTNLSPAAQQVFWEFNRAASGRPDDWHYLPAIAAALRAAADQVVPPDTDYASNEVLMIALNVRHQFHAIAAELEAQ